MSDATITYLVLASVVLVFVWGRVPITVAAIGVALALWATGVLGIEQALAGFGDPTVIFIASLFVVSEGLDATGVTAWAGQRLIVAAGESRTRLIVLTMTLVALFTALINVNGAVAALVPVVVVMALRVGRPPSQLLLPLAFAAHAGSLLALTGTPVNVIVSDAAADAGVGRFGVLRVRARRGAARARDDRHRGTARRAVSAVANGARRSGPTSADTPALSSKQYGLEHPPDTLLTRRSGVAEVIIPPRSSSPAASCSRAW